MFLTSQPGFWHIICFVMDPFWTEGPDVGLGGSVGHRVIANPGCQVDVESIWVNDSICIHQTLFSQLQKWKIRTLSEWSFVIRAQTLTTTARNTSNTTVYKNRITTFCKKHYT